jgi:hypothetical protein
MQLQHLASYSPLTDRKECIKLSTRVETLLNKTINEIDNKLVLNAGDLDQKEKAKNEEELDKFNKFKLDVLFTIHNLYKLNNDYSEALEYAKKHT